MKKLIKKILGKKFDMYLEEINIRNYNNFKTFTRVGLIISFLVFIFGIIHNKFLNFSSEILMILIYFILLVIISKFMSRAAKKYITAIFYISITPIMIMGTMLGTFLDRYNASITIMVLICVLTLFIIDKPWRILIYLIAVCVFYSICCYIAKPYDLFVKDIIHLIIFLQVAIGVNFFTLRDRFECVENYVKYKKRAEIDLLTHIYNRGSGIEKIKSLISQGIKGAFLIIDIDNFKCINDTYGHIRGDNALKLISKTIKNCFREDDVVLRLGGDEFAVYAIGLSTKEDCEKCCQRFIEKLNIIQEDRKFACDLGVSLGCSIFNSNVMNFNELYEKSDKCLYEAKKLGKGCFYVEE